MTFYVSFSGSAGGTPPSLREVEAMRRAVGALKEVAIALSAGGCTVGVSGTFPTGDGGASEAVSFSYLGRPAPPDPAPPAPEPAVAVQVEEVAAEEGAPSEEPLPACAKCGTTCQLVPCGSREFVPFMETGGNCSNCGHGLPCHPEEAEATADPALF